VVAGVPAIMEKFQVGKKKEKKHRKTQKDERPKGLPGSTTQRLILILLWLPSAREAGKWSFLAGHITQCFITKGKRKNGWWVGS